MFRSFIKKFSFVAVSLMGCMSAQCETPTMTLSTANHYIQMHHTDPNSVPTCVQFAIDDLYWLKGMTSAQFVQASCNNTANYPATLSGLCNAVCVTLYGPEFLHDSSYNDGEFNANAFNCYSSCYGARPPDMPIQTWSLPVTKRISSTVIKNS